MAAARAAIIACLLGVASGSLVDPSWDYSFPTQKAYCVDVHSTAFPNNIRWVFGAVPQGTPPAGGWPVFVSLTTDNFPPNDGSPACGQQARTRKQFKAFSTPKESMATCFPNTSTPLSGFPGESPYFKCSDALDSVCPHQASAKACDACASANSAKLTAAGCTSEMLEHACSPSLLKCYGAYEKACPHKKGTECLECAQGASDALEAAGCTSALMQQICGGGHGSSCMYDQQAGQMWQQRLLQVLVANGIAVLQPNPIVEDSWDAGPWYWDSGADKVGGRSFVANCVVCQSRTFSRQQAPPPPTPLLQHAPPASVPLEHLLLRDRQPFDASTSTRSPLLPP